MSTTPTKAIAVHNVLVSTISPDVSFPVLIEYQCQALMRCAFGLL